MLAIVARLWPVLAILAAALGLLLLAVGVSHRTAATIERLQTAAATAAREERDAHWRAEIARANAAAERARAEQAAAAVRAEAEIRAGEVRIETQQRDLEAANAALAGGDRCGLERDRVRLLDGSKR